MEIKIPFLKAYLKKRFKPGMTWDNYGLWHVDHRVPCSKFDLTDPAEQLLSNLQPLFAEDNLKKGNRLDKPTQVRLF